MKIIDYVSFMRYFILLVALLAGCVGAEPVKTSKDFDMNYRHAIIEYRHDVLDGHVYIKDQNSDWNGPFNVAELSMNRLCCEYGYFSVTKGFVYMDFDSWNEQFFAIPEAKTDTVVNTKDSVK